MTKASFEIPIVNQLPTSCEINLNPSVLQPIWFLPSLSIYTS